jgi:hypothetical protein
MSSVSRQFFAPADLVMLGRVLDQANFQRSHVPSDREARLDASRFLIASFQKGVTSEAALGSSLSGWTAMEAQPPETLGSADAAAIFSAFRRTKSRAIPGLKWRYGKPCGATGRRTVYHVVAEIHDRFQASDMVEIDIKTALGALRMLNSPERSA